MNRLHSILRFTLPASLVALSLFCATAFAEVPLRAFTAHYDLHRGNMHFATAELSLAPHENFWRWRLTTRTRGIYTMFYNKKPYTESIFLLDPENMRLHSLELSDEDEIDEEEYESAHFDWESGEMKVLRKGTQRRVKLSQDVYDYQTIHLLAAAMQLRGTSETSVKFYRKGKLVDSQLVYQGMTSIEVGSETMEARVYEHRVERSSSVSRYYYNARDPLLPLQVETRKDDDEPTVLRLREVEWHS